MWWILWTKDSQPQSQVDLFNYWVYHQDSNICAFYYSDYVLHIDLTYFQLVKSYHSNSCLDIWTWGTDMKWQIHLININNSFLILILFTAHGFGLVEYLVFYPQECISLTMSCLLPPKNCSDWWKTLIITITNDFFLTKWGEEEGSSSKENRWKGSKSGQTTWCYWKRLSIWNQTGHTMNINQWFF